MRWLDGITDAMNMSEDEMAGQHHRCNEHELGQTLGDGEGQGSLACCSPWGLITSNNMGSNNHPNNIVGKDQGGDLLQAQMSCT